MLPDLDPENVNLPVEKTDTQISVLVEGPAKLPCPAIPGELVSNVFYSFFSKLFCFGFTCKNVLPIK